MKSKYNIVVLVIALLGCNSQPMAWFKKNTCVEQANGSSQLPPCWLSKAPETGIVLDGVKHVGPNGWQKAKQALADQASLAFSLQRQGQEVSTSVLIYKEVEDNNGQISQQGKVTRIAEFNQSDDAVNVRVRIIDYYYQSVTEQVFIWVEEQL